MFKRKLTIALALAYLMVFAEERGGLPVVGREVRELSDLDSAVQSLMRKWDLKGGQLAIAKNGRIVLSRAYGWADADQRQRVQLDSLFRVGSVSKTLTTAAILKLLDAGQLRLDDKAFALLPHLTPFQGAIADPRIGDITIQHLLQHAGGWREGEPSFTMPFTRVVAEASGAPAPPTCEAVIRSQLMRALDFTPGSATSYSNFGFCILGRVIEAVASRAGGRRISYEEFVRREVLAPAGVKRVRLGGTLLSERAEGEVRYYGPANQEPVDSVYPGGGKVPFAYGGLYLRSTDSSGGWIASAEDLVKFVTALDGQRGRPILTAESISRMLDTPVPASHGQTGLCWTVAKREAGVDYWHIGALRNSNVSWLVRTSEGATLAVVFNTFPHDFDAFAREAIPGLLDRLKSPRRWPKATLRRATYPTSLTGFP